MITVVLGVLFAFVFPSVVEGLIEVWKVTAYLGVAFWLGVMWKRANRYGAWASATTMALASIITGNFLDWGVASQIALYIPLGIIVMIVVSRFTRPEPEDKLRQFYLLLDTPVGREQRLRDANVEIKLEGESQAKSKKVSSVDDTKEVDDGLLIVDFLSLPKKFSWQRYKTDITGFTIMAVLAAGLIFLAIFLAGIGA
jgi:hypothetical protein